jgi:hypothetical protein
VSKVLMPLLVKTREEQVVPAGQYEGGPAELHAITPQVEAAWTMQVLAVALHAPFTQKPLWQLAPEVQADPFPAPTHAPFAHANPLAQALPQAPQLVGSEAVLSQYVPQSVPVQVSVSPDAPILYSTSRFASAPVFDAQVEPVRKIDWRVAPAAKVITMGPLSDQ